MPIFRPKSKQVEARRWTGENWAEMREWLDYAYFGYGIVRCSLVLENRTGRVIANRGDWIVRLDDGFYPVEPVKFHAEYEAAT
jgi:hypothetical protein